MAFDKKDYVPVFADVDDVTTNLELMYKHILDTVLERYNNHLTGYKVPEGLHLVCRSAGGESIELALHFDVVRHFRL